MFWFLERIAWLGLGWCAEKKSYYFMQLWAVLNYIQLKQKAFIHSSLFDIYSAKIHKKEAMLKYYSWPAYKSAFERVSNKQSFRLNRNNNMKMPKNTLRGGWQQDKISCPVGTLDCVLGLFIFVPLYWKYQYVQHNAQKLHAFAAVQILQSL